MRLDEIQKEVDEWTGQFEPQYWPPHEILARMAEEVGELAREINHVHGTKKKKVDERDNSIEDELSDILFTIVCMANSKGISLCEAWKRMMEVKMRGRDKNRFTRK